MHVQMFTWCRDLNRYFDNVIFYFDYLIFILLMYGVDTQNINWEITVNIQNIFMNIFLNI